MSDFKALGVSDKYIEILKKNGIKEPTSIQKMAIPEILAGRNVIGQSQTGTGKTLAFVLPIIEKLDINKTHIQAVIITPTRELALQIHGVFTMLTSNTDINVLAAYGGHDVDDQIKKLKGNVHVVIGTPGRLMDHINRKTLDLSKTRMIVLDEADVMLKMGFIEDVEQIIKKTFPARQTMIFSATIPKVIRMIARRYLKNPADLSVKTRTISVEGIDQAAFETTEEDKLDMLISLLKVYNPFMAMVFCSSKKRVSQVAERIFEAGYLVDEIHGDLTQVKRERIMKSFRDLKLQVLVATDIAARGLDIQGLTHVFNYDVPHSTEWYIHRIGRTGRAGENGTAVTLYTQKDAYYLSQIEKGINKRIPKKQLKNGEIVDVPKKTLSEGKGSKAKEYRPGFGPKSKEKGYKTFGSGRAKLAGRKKSR